MTLTETLLKGNYEVEQRGRYWLVKDPLGLICGVCLSEKATYYKIKALRARLPKLFSTDNNTSNN